MGYIDGIESNVNMRPQERRERFRTFLSKVTTRKHGVIQFNLIRAMAYCGDFDFSNEAQEKFVRDFNFCTTDDCPRDVMIRVTQPVNTHAGTAYFHYIIRMPKHGDKINSMLIEDNAIHVGEVKF